MEKNKNVSNVATELLPNIKNLTDKLIEWCLEYQKFHDDLEIYFEDELVRIYKINKIQNIKTS